MSRNDAMKTKECIAVMQGFLDGKPVQIRDYSGTQPWADCADPEPGWDWVACDYRIKPMEFPSLPEGLVWHNPAELTPEQVGEGFRLLVKGELVPSYKIAELWKSDTSVWTSVHHKGMHPTSLTYRVPASHPFPKPPKPKVMVPLGPEDVPPGPRF